MNTQAATPNSLQAILLREHVLDDSGKPMYEGDYLRDPIMFELANSREPELLELGRGQLLILSPDDAEFARKAFLHSGNDDDLFIRAILTLDPSCPVYRMGDFVTVAPLDVGAITYQVLLTHEDFPAEVLLSEDDFPPKLMQPGEMCLLLRPDL